MLIRLLNKYPNTVGLATDYGLIDVLRSLSQFKSQDIVDRLWLVRDVDFYAYADDFTSGRLQFLFPERDLPRGEEQVLVTGERLLERSALIHFLEEGWFLRVVDAQRPIEVDTEYKLYRGPARLQATNIDLEIRCNEAPIEVVTKEKDMIFHLQSHFAKTEIEQ